MTTAMIRRSLMMLNYGGASLPGISSTMGTWGKSARRLLHLKMIQMEVRCRWFWAQELATPNVPLQVTKGLHWH
jgi:hypothetical protein